MKRSLSPLAAAGIALAGAALAASAYSKFSPGKRGNAAVPEPAKPVDLDRYLGKWYEYARYENGFERGCEGVTAEYAKRDDGLISVRNTCHEECADGKSRTSEGRARVVPGSDGAKLEVSFFGPFFFGNYWVLDHGDDYSWSIVGEPSGRYLWLLTRDAAPSRELADSLVAHVAELGYDTSLLRMTMH
nr:lipocalin family protein [uncultured Cupriavidus sp.]